jgi:hypothetical protein
MAWLDRIDVELSGGCQCGAVRYHATQRHDNAHICHCRMCQKAMGSFFAPLVGLPLDRFAWARGTPSVFMSSEHVERGFCSNCGTPLYYRNLNSPRIAVTIGSLDHPELVMPIRQLGNESKLPYFAALGSLPGDTTTEQDDPDDVVRIRASNRQHPDHDTDVWPPAGRGR